MRRVSKSKDKWLSQYLATRTAQKKQGWVICAETGKRVPYHSRQPHHINRRLKQNILIFCCITPGLHEWIEGHTKEAKEQGWLRNQGQGYPVDPNQPRPWKHCYNEELLEE